MPTPYVEVIVPDQSPQFVELAGTHVVVGSAITCQVVIERADVAREHLLLQPRPDGCFVATARGVQLAPTVKGAPVERGIVPWGSELLLAGARLVLHDGAVSMDLRKAGRAAGSGTGEKPQISPVVLVAIAVVIPLLGWMILRKPVEESVRLDVAAPALFDDLNRACPQSDSAQARGLADESLRQAIAKAERMPFHIQDGIEAVGAYATAAACYRAVGDTDRAQQQMVAAGVLSTTINDEFYNHRFRLDRALEQDNVDDALTEARLLGYMVAHRTGPYLSMLTALERRLALQLEQRTEGAAPAR